MPGSFSCSVQLARGDEPDNRVDLPLVELPLSSSSWGRNLGVELPLDLLDSFPSKGKSLGHFVAREALFQQGGGISGSLL